MYFLFNGWGCSCYLIGVWILKDVYVCGGDLNVLLLLDWDKIDLKIVVLYGIDKGWVYLSG